MAERLHRMNQEDALALRWRQGAARCRGEDLSRAFVGNSAEEALVECVDLDLYAGEMVRQGHSRTQTAYVKRQARQVALILRRALVAMDHGGIAPPNPIAQHFEDSR